MNATPHVDVDALSAGTLRKFVRVISAREDGLITFELSVGWPELFVELMLPAQAFAEFCTREQVERLDI